MTGIIERGDSRLRDCRPLTRNEHRRFALAKSRIPWPGRVFGRLTVEAIDHWEGPVAFLLCRCECGNRCITRGTNLSGHFTKSCGCLRRELVATIRLTHGQCIHPLYTVWRGMRRRCGNPVPARGRILAQRREGCGRPGWREVSAVEVAAHPGRWANWLPLPALSNTPENPSD